MNQVNLFNLLVMKDKSKLGHLSLIILDGLGERENSKGNAYKLAKTPFLDYLKATYPSILINASEKWVGLPEGQMGNSEVGHLNIGSGRLIKQSLIEIGDELDNKKKFIENKGFKKILNHLKNNPNSKLHLLGLFSYGGIHSSAEHFYKLKDILDEAKIDFYLHAFTDGRDADPHSAEKYIKEASKKNVKIASISGRYYAMDRDRRWERIQLAYDVMIENKGASFLNPAKFIKESYDKNVTDEFIIPGYNKQLNIKIEDNDVVLFFNFRSDRIREISHMLVGSDENVTKYHNKPPKVFKNLLVASFKEITDIKSTILFEQGELKNTIGDVLEQNNISQIRGAETEKYPHVTFFMDGGKSIDRKKELKILIPSPKVATYDLQPEMSAIPLTEKLLKEIPNYKTSIINFANPDMVGHTGVLEAGIKAVETVDAMTKKLYDLIVKKLNGIMLITADHGNAETMIDDNGKVCTTHTTNKVRLFITSKEYDFKDEYKKNIKGKLSDLAPTMLDILKIKKPKEMDGKSLIIDKK